jgi:hypothetical protein
MKSGGFGELHFEQIRSIFVPHFPQKGIPSGLAKLHFGQTILNPKINFHWPFFRGTFQSLNSDPPCATLQYIYRFPIDPYTEASSQDNPMRSSGLS